MVEDVVVLGPDEDPPIRLTERAAIAAKEVMLSESFEGDGLRIGIRGGGCAGYQYHLDFSFPQPYDFILEFWGLKVYVDPVSAMHLEGTTVDYVSGLMESGFKFNNPHARTTCGCGSSFQ